MSPRLASLALAGALLSLSSCAHFWPLPESKCDDWLEKDSSAPAEKAWRLDTCAKIMQEVIYDGEREASISGKDWALSGVEFEVTVAPDGKWKGLQLEIRSTAAPGFEEMVRLDVLREAKLAPPPIASDKDGLYRWKFSNVPA